jgi:hypothetical protein
VPSWHYLAKASVIIVALALLVPACTIRWPADPPPGEILASSPYLLLRGDPNFSRSQLTAEQQLLYDRLWAELNDPTNRQAVLELADSDDIFIYGRRLHGYLQSILTVFRATGDLRLLDHVDVIAQRMRSQLQYGWRDTNDGTDGTWDQYLMWVYRNVSSSSLYGKDRKIDDIKTHGIIAMIAYTLDLNRDLTSPSGRNYGDSGDYWKWYLTQHWEPKWRERSSTRTEHPITKPHPDGHTWWTWIKLSYYMGHLTSDPGWLTEAHRAADILWEHEIKDVRIVDGAPYSAYVWSSNIQYASSSRIYQMSTSYANSVYGDAVTFHLEGFHRWADPTIMTNFARSITAYQFDTDDIIKNGITADVGGDVTRAGIAPSGDVRRSARTFTQYETPLIAAWDTTNTIARTLEQLNNEYPSTDTTRVTAGLFLNAYMRQQRPTQGR